MSNKSESENIASENASADYPKPLILVMNMSADVTTYLRGKGFNVENGSFGQPYKADNGRQMPIYFNGNIPSHHSEKEIVIVDLSVKGIEIVDPALPKYVNSDGSNLVEIATNGVIDPRPIVMLNLQKDFERIYHHGGIFIIFASQKSTITNKLTGSWEEIGSFNDHHSVNTWAFLSGLASTTCQVTSEVGKEMFIEGSNDLTQIIQQYITTGQYECTVEVDLKERWIPIARNKFGKSIAGVLLPENEASGYILIFPQIENKAQLIEQLLLEFLPSRASTLFPYFEGINWIYRPEYELPQIKNLQLQIQKIKEESTKKIQILEEEIAQENEATLYLRELLVGTGDHLRDAVHHALKVLGFSNVVIMDEGLTRADTKREDLQVRDNSKLLLVEVKGIGGTPKDSSSLAILKYILYHTRHNKDFERNQIYGVSIINHQKNIRLFDRKYNPFSEEVLASAAESNFGLLTTWNLHKLVRSFLKLNWSHESVRDLFYQSNFIEPIPAHYEYIGDVETFWEKHSVVGIKIHEAELRKGDRIAFELQIEFEEQLVESLQVENIPVDCAEKGTLAAILTPFTKNQLKSDKTVRVFRIKQPS